MRSLSTLFLALIIPCLACADGAGSIEVALKLVEAIGIKGSVRSDFDASISNIITQLKQQGDETLTKTITELTNKFFDENYGWEKMGPVYAECYAKALTDDEMKAVMTFFESSAGKKFVAASPTIKAEVSKAVQAATKTQLLSLQRAMIEAVQKRQIEKQQGAK